MKKPHEWLAHHLKLQKDLKALKKKIDPASGMTVQVHRGPVAEEDNEEDVRHPSLTVEMCSMDLMTRVLDLMIESSRESMVLWESSARKDMKDTLVVMRDLKELRELENTPEKEINQQGRPKTT